MKFILSAVFALLLAIPAVYVGLTWSPVNPLRFRAVVATGNEAPVGWRNLEIFVKNTSYAPVHLLVFSQGPKTAYIGPLNVKPDPVFGNITELNPNLWTIPPQGELRTFRIIKESELQQVDGEYWMQYACISTTKERGIRFLRWVHANGPPWLSRHVPNLGLRYEAVLLETPLRPTETTPRWK